MVRHKPTTIDFREESLREIHRIAALQRNLVQGNLPPPPGWRWAAYYSVGTWPGGDYYRLRSLPDGRVQIFLADASGHGGPAAFLVAMVHVMLQTCPLTSGLERLPFCPLVDTVVSPRLALGHLNEILLENSLEDQFMTAFLGLLDPRTGTFVHANAGHPPPRLLPVSADRVVGLEDTSNYPLGILPGVTYRDAAGSIAPGDVLLFHTDGLVDLRNPEGETFGRDRLDDLLLRSRSRGAEAIKNAILDATRKFLAGGHPDDDVTFLVLERLSLR